MKKTLILGIETSCDETALSLVEASGPIKPLRGYGASGFEFPKFKVLKNLVASQVKVHQPFGGVVPNLAKREHLKNLPILFEQIFENSKSEARNPKQIRKSKLQSKSGKLHATGYMLHDLDLIAVTVGPGLEPALWTGITFAKELCENVGRKRLDVRLIGVNHLEGHLYSFLLPQKNAGRKRLDVGRIFPAVALIVSGGHTILLLVKDLKTWKKLGETRDDAAGEAFDKVARLLNLPYPGGPALEKLARAGNPRAIDFPRPMIHEKSFDFSFSGLKTSVLYHLRDLGYSQWPLATRVNSRKLPNPIPQTLMADIAASFQAAAIDVLVKKAMRAVAEFNAKSVMLSGGVAANKKLRTEIKKEAKKTGVNFLVADQKYNTDNAVMIAAAGYMADLRGKKYPLRANGNLDI